MHLLDNNVLKVDILGAKYPSYSIVYDMEDISGMFLDIEVKAIEVKEEKNNFYLTIKFKKSTSVREILLLLDTERLVKADVQLESIINKYCSYLVLKK